MSGITWGVARRAGAVVAATTLLSGCWLQVGFAADHARHNVLESGITAGNVATLQEAWSTSFAGTATEPLVSGGRVYLTRSDAADSSADVRAFDAATGAGVWQHVLLPPQPPDPNIAIIPPPVAFSGDTLWASFAGIGLGFGTVELDPGDGTVLSSSGGEVVTSPVVTGEGVAASLRVIGSDSSLVVRDPDTAAVQWTGSLTRLGLSDLAIARGHVYVPDDSVLKAFAVAGCGAASCVPAWQATLPVQARVQHVAVGPDGTVLVTTTGPTVADDSVMAFDGRTGALRWTRNLPAIVDDGLAVAGDHVYVTIAGVPDGSGGTVGVDGLLALTLAGGATSWLAILPAHPGVPLVAAGVLYLGVGDGLDAFDAAGCGGGIACTPIAAFPGAGSPRSIGEGQIYTTSTVAGQTTLRALRPA